MSYESELAGLRETLELPVVGHRDRSSDLTQLRRLIEQYEDEARQVYGEIRGRSRAGRAALCPSWGRAD